MRRGLGMVDVSVVIPTLDEEKSIGQCIEKVNKIFKEHNIDGEIIVSDSSTDSTAEIARSLGARVVHPDKRGYGYAYLYAFDFVRGRYIVMGDADNTYDFLEIPKFLEPLQNGSDMVIGNRLGGEIRDGAMPWLHRHIGNPMLTRLLNMFFKAGVSDAHCGFRAFKRDALNKMRLRSSGMEFASEMIIEACRKKLNISEIPIIYHPRIGEAKLNSLRDGWRHIKFMTLRAPKYLYYLPGFFLLGLGFSLVVLITMFELGIDGLALGTLSMIASSLTAIIGYQLIFLGLFTTTFGSSKEMIDSDRITEKINQHITLERGATIGALVFAVGLGYTISLLGMWVGGNILPTVKQSMLGFTLIVLGLQTVFFSFALSMVGKGE